jgi:hypothetical protein
MFKYLVNLTLKVSKIANLSIDLNAKMCRIFSPCFSRNLENIENSCSLLKKLKLRRQFVILTWNDSKQIEFSIFNPRKSRLNPHKLLITHFWNVTVEKLVLFIDQHMFHLFDANVRQTGIAELQQIAHFLQLLWGKNQNKPIEN